MNQPPRSPKQQPPQQFRSQFQPPSPQPSYALQQYPQWQQPTPPPQYQQPQQYQPQTPPPNMVPQKPKSHKRLLLIIGIVVLTLIVIVSIASQAGNSDQSTKSQATRPASTAQQTMPTTIPSTAKPIPAHTVITNAGPTVLGGTLSAFIAKFGPPNDHSSTGMPHFQRCSNSNVDQIILSQVALESTSSSITSVDIQACTSWSMTQATATCSSYFPTDAKYQHTIQIASSQTKFASVDKIYYSATLAHVFAADNFTDVNGNTVQPGLFDVNYLSNSNSDMSNINSCTIQLGTQQTNG